MTLVTQKDCKWNKKSNDAMKRVGDRDTARKGDFFMKLVPISVKQGEVIKKMFEIRHWGRTFSKGLVKGGLVGFATENLEEESKTPEQKT